MRGVHEIDAGVGVAALSGSVVVVEDDPDIARLLEVTLEFEGLDVTTVADGRSALAIVTETIPDLVILDLALPFMDGIDVCRAIRTHPKTANVSIIMVTARGSSSDRLAGFGAGADDYVTKPFDPPEVLARARVAIDRSRVMRAVNPLTQLPGNVQLHSRLEEVIAAGDPFALLYVDLDNFKAYNDYYGFLRGDEVLKLAARRVEEAVDSHGGGFVGHIGGDDFVAIVDAPVAESLALDIIESWDAFVGRIYDPDDLARGYIEVLDRRDHLHRFPIMTISIGIATNLHKVIDTVGEAVTIATEMKASAKRKPRSSYALDRRRNYGEY